LRLTVDGKEDGAQNLVTPDYLTKRTLEYGDVEGSINLKGRRTVVGRAVAVELVQEPEALLGEG
jgi:hypothetical protein